MKLYHSLGSNYNRAIKGIEVDGLLLSNAVKFAWADVNEFVPNRPVGTFFWGEDLKKGAQDIMVDTKDINTGLLFGFPTQYAWAANQAAAGQKLTEKGRDLLINAEGIPFCEWDGETEVEWIYTGDISPEQMTIL